jgi:WD40 repeat protein
VPDGFVLAVRGTGVRKPASSTGGEHTMIHGRARLVLSVFTCALAAGTGTGADPRPVIDVELPGSVLGMAPFGDGFLLACGHDLVLVGPDLKTHRKLATEKGVLDGVVVSPDSKRVAYGWGPDNLEAGGRVRILGASFKVEHTLETPANRAVRALAFDSTGAVLAVTSLSQKGDDGVHRTVYYDAGTGKQAFLPEQLGTDVVTVAHTPDGKLLVLATADGPVRLISAADFKEVGVLEHDHRIQDLTVSADSGYLACYGLFNEILIWDLGTRKLHRKLAGHTKSVVSVAIDERAGLLASSAFDGSVRVWDLADGKVLWEATAAHPDGPSRVALSGSRKAVVSFGTNDAKLRVWELPPEVRARFK